MARRATQVPKQVMDRGCNIISLGANANTYGRVFLTSRRNDEMILSARAGRRWRIFSTAI